MGSHRNPESNPDSHGCEPSTLPLSYITIPIEQMILSIDALSDEEYLRAVMTMDLEVRESLMASEAERRRTFRHWPLGSVNWEDCAKTGLYYTGWLDGKGYWRVFALAANGITVE